MSFAILMMTVNGMYPVKCSEHNVSHQNSFRNRTEGFIKLNPLSLVCLLRSVGVFPENLPDEIVLHGEALVMRSAIGIILKVTHEMKNACKGESPGQPRPEVSSQVCFFQRSSWSILCLFKCCFCCLSDFYNFVWACLCCLSQKLKHSIYEKLKQCVAHT